MINNVEGLSIVLADRILELIHYFVYNNIEDGTDLADVSNFVLMSQISALYNSLKMVSHSGGPKFKKSTNYYVGSDKSIAGTFLKNLNKGGASQVGIEDLKIFLQSARK